MQFAKPTLLLMALAAACPVHAAQPPDAGRTLQENTPELPQPLQSQEFEVEPPAAQETLPGGVTVVLQSMQFEGNTRFSDEALLKSLGEVTGKSYDLAGLRSLAENITVFYRAHGYSFARAYLPAQSMKEGRLQINIVEGRYGEVRAIGDEGMASGAQAFLAPLVPGEVIESGPLERAVLILDDLPGIRVTPLIRPGQANETGDLDVKVEQEKRFGGNIGADNFGNRYTGRYRGRAATFTNSLLMFGDQVTLSGLYTNEDMWFGSLGYSAPIGTSGLRGQVSYVHTYYELGKEFSSLDATGTAKVASAGLSYPLLRSQRANLLLSGSYQHKRLHDEQDTTGISDHKSSDSLPLTLSYDLRDSLGGGGITYGALSWTHGKLHLDSTLAAADAATAGTEGHFDKLNLDIARVQLLPRNFSLFARASAQWAGDNLDSSEGFGLGGPTGVRSYPTGESFGDEGWLGQVELRYTYRNLVPFAFYDTGHIKVNHDNWAGGDNSRTISGAGVGLRANAGNWYGSASAAWRLYGGEPESDNEDHKPMVWVEAGYTF